MQCRSVRPFSLGLNTPNANISYSKFNSILLLNLMNFLFLPFFNHFFYNLLGHSSTTSSFPMEKQSDKTPQALPELLPGPFQDEFDAFRKYYNVIMYVLHSQKVGVA